MSGEHSSDVAAFRHFQTLFNMHASLHRQLKINALPVSTLSVSSGPSNGEAMGNNPSYDDMISLSASLYSEQQSQQSQQQQSQSQQQQQPQPHHPSGRGSDFSPIFSPPYMSSTPTSGISTPTHSHSHSHKGKPVLCYIFQSVSKNFHPDQFITQPNTSSPPQYSSPTLSHPPHYPSSKPQPHLLLFIPPLHTTVGDIQHTIS